MIGLVAARIGWMIAAVALIGGHALFILLGLFLICPHLLMLQLEED